MLWQKVHNWCHALTVATQLVSCTNSRYTKGLMHWQLLYSWSHALTDSTQLVSCTDSQYTTGLMHWQLLNNWSHALTDSTQLGLMHWQLLHNLTTVRSSQQWCHDDWSIVSAILRKCRTFNFRVKQLRIKEYFLHYLTLMMKALFCNTGHQTPIIWHSITIQNNWIFSMYPTTETHSPLRNFSFTVYQSECKAQHSVPLHTTTYSQTTQYASYKTGFHQHNRPPKK
jgi:hypothetical protein